LFSKVFGGVGGIGTTGELIFYWCATWGEKVFIERTTRIAENNTLNDAEPKVLKEDDTTRNSFPSSS